MATETTYPDSALPLEDLKSIVGALRAANPEAEEDSSDWLDAAITGSFSFSSGGGSLQGWITFYDGTKVHFSGRPTRRTGTAAGTFALPLIRVRPASTFAGKTGNFGLKGFMLGGTLSLYCDGHSITAGSIAVVSAAPWNYEMDGTVQYTRG